MEKILVIDDDKLIRESIKEVFQMEGFEVDCAFDGLDGIDKTKKNEYDFIICDIDMPVLNGYEVIKHIKNDDRYLNIPFVFLTGRIKSSEIIKGLKLGADYYITKPFDFNEIIEIVRSKISKKRKIEKLINEKLDKIKSSISYSLPHEFITPINGILGPISMLIDENQKFTEDETKEMHKIIFQSANRIKQTTEKFLIFNELSFRDFENTNYEVINVKEVFEMVYDKSCVERNRKVDVYLNLIDFELNFNLRFFKVLISEILQNSFKFSNYGDAIICKSFLSEDCLKIEITDNGRGMTKSQIDKIDAFIQFDRVSYEQQGIGLGIAIIKRIANLYDLKVVFESEIGVYTRVSLIFPNKLILAEK